MRLLVMARWECCHGNLMTLHASPYISYFHGVGCPAAGGGGWPAGATGAAAADEQEPAEKVAQAAAVSVTGSSRLDV